MGILFGRICPEPYQKGSGKDYQIGVSLASCVIDKGSSQIRYYQWFTRPYDPLLFFVESPIDDVFRDRTFTLGWDEYEPPDGWDEEREMDKWN